MEEYRLSLDAIKTLFVGDPCVIQDFTCKLCIQISECHLQLGHQLGVLIKAVLNFA